MNFTHNYHPLPRLSANQMSDYLRANATNRTRILRDAKFPPTALLIRYDEAKHAIAAHLTTSSSHSDSLNRKLQSLMRKVEDAELTDYQRKNCELCIDAITSFQSGEALLKLNKVTFTKPTTPSVKLKISGVSISVSLDLRSERTVKGIKSVGGAILIFSKSVGPAANMQSRCKATTLLIQELVKQQLAQDEVLDPKLCIAIDVLGAQAYRATGPQKMLLKTVENSCGEVATVWPSIQPPSNYNGPPIS